jgi:heme A synthase
MDMKEESMMIVAHLTAALAPVAMCVHLAMMLGREVREGLDQAGFGRMILVLMAMMSGIMTAYMVLPLGPDMQALAWSGLGGALAPIVGALAGYFIPRAHKTH